LGLGFRDDKEEGFETSSAASLLTVLLKTSSAASTADSAVAQL
jgi:hypothetical protein